MFCSDEVGPRCIELLHLLCVPEKVTREHPYHLPELPDPPDGRDDFPVETAQAPLGLVEGI